MILVTGAKGTVGKEVVRELVKLHANFKISTSKKNTSDVYLNFEDPKSIRPAFQGITKLFLIRPPHLADKKYFEPVIEIAKEVGIEQIVFLSLLGADKNKVVPHSKIEELIINSGIPYTFLRPSFFMQNLLNQHEEELIKENIIFVPAGKGKTSFIDTRDIGVVAAKALTENGHRFKAYSLTGNEAISYFEVAEILSKHLQKDITYTNPSILTFWRKMRKKGLARDFIIVMIGIYTTAKLGLAKKITTDLEDLLGRESTRFEQFVIDYSDLLK
ncbi:NmrA family transcriptional regulator [Bacillus sp. FJAT-25509]|uniref:SDR family oxidoreductase n=1 Tax=Bacillus sp. FJAT-25509 TaxID=1712029 RepID=UPI0006F51763|nr:SDR family oxidoreductase [Bacillus sp. FJAT-25509]KQL32683.1 NmrA family transcriptional regulator [Bacillus sp. FJAT-25509]